MIGSSGDFRSMLVRDCPFVIGEVSGNHNGSIGHENNGRPGAGFDAVKLQTYPTV